MVAVSLVSVLVFIGAIPTPFLNDFSKGEEAVKAGEVPCLPEGENTPASPESMHVSVLNATGRPNLAGPIASALESLGVNIDNVGNYSGQYYGAVRLDAGRSQVVNAYTLARVFVDSTVRYVPSDPNSVTIIIGENFTDLPSSEEVSELLLSEQPLVQSDKCKALPDAEDVPSQAPTDGSSEGDGATEPEATEPEATEAAQ